MKIGVIGSGDVGKTLAAGWLAEGHPVMLGSNHPDKLTHWAAAHPDARVGSFLETAAFGEVLLLAVRGDIAEAVVRDLAAHLEGTLLRGKPVLDACNPIAPRPPQDGLLSFFTGPDESLLERLQAAAPAAALVKAFNSVGAAAMVHPDFGGLTPTMFICGNDTAAKAQAATLIAALGWEVDDLGPASIARAIEPLCRLWCVPGFTRNDWFHAFKMLRR